MDIVVFGAPNLQDIVFDDKTSYAFFVPWLQDFADIWMRYE